MSEDRQHSFQAGPNGPPPAPGIAALVRELAEDAVAFIAQGPGIAAALPEIARAVEAAAATVLPEQCRVAAVPVGPDAGAFVVTPASGEPLTPLMAHAMANRITPALVDRCGPDASITPLARVQSVSTIQGNLQVLDQLLDTIVNRKLAVQFQPILNLSMGRIYGYEALARLPKDLAVRRVGAMYEAADRARVVAWLDLSCHEKCVAEAQRAGIREYLFLNMEAEGLALMDEAQRSVGALAESAGIAPGRIVLEVTERQAVQDFARVMDYIERIRARGMKIAMDDAGEGYSSLHAIMEMRPDFVKVGRQLVRGIDSSAPRRALLEALNGYATRLGSAVIAEGIETRDELAAVMDIGVEFGQGYLFARPKDYFRGLRPEMRDLLQDLSRQRTARRLWSGRTIGELARQGMVYAPETPLAEVTAKLAKNPEVESVMAVRDGIAAGLLMRHRVPADGGAGGDETLAGAVDRRPLTVEAETPLEVAADRAAFRREMRFPDDIVVVANGRYEGVVSQRVLLSEVARLHLARGRHRSPLSGLPTRVPLEQELAGRLHAGETVLVVRARISGMDAYNARTGLAGGDELLAASAEAAFDACRQIDARAFVAHTGGATFHALLVPDTAGRLADALLGGFASVAQLPDPEFPHGRARTCRMRIVCLSVDRALPNGYADVERLLDDLERRSEGKGLDVLIAA